LPEKIGTLLQESRWLAVGAVALFFDDGLWGFNKEDPGWSHASFHTVCITLPDMLVPGLPI
jgi:hypothetical protein